MPLKFSERVNVMYLKFVKRVRYDQKNLNSVDEIARWGLVVPDRAKKDVWRRFFRLSEMEKFLDQADADEAGLSKILGAMMKSVQKISMKLTV